MSKTYEAMLDQRRSLINRIDSLVATGVKLWQIKELEELRELFTGDWYYISNEEFLEFARKNWENF